MKKLLLLACLALLFTYSTDAHGASKCRTKRGYTARYDEKRKRCVYTRIPRSKWTIKNERDSFTGQRYLYAYLPAEGTISGMVARYRPQLYVRCMGKVLDIFIAFGPVMSCGDDSYRMRFDNFSIFDLAVTPADDCSTMFWDDSSYDTHYFLYSMHETNKLRVQAYVYGVGYQNVTFSLAGAADIYKKMLARCPEPARD